MLDGAGPLDIEDHGQPVGIVGRGQVVHGLRHIDVGAGANPLSEEPSHLQAMAWRHHVEGHVHGDDVNARPLVSIQLGKKLVIGTQWQASVVVPD